MGKYGIHPCAKSSVQVDPENIRRKIGLKWSIRQKNCLQNPVSIFLLDPVYFFTDETDLVESIFQYKIADLVKIYMKFG
jgi:hypothetical protein